MSGRLRRVPNPPKPVDLTDPRLPHAINVAEAILEKATPMLAIKNLRAQLALMDDVQRSERVHTRRWNRLRAEIEAGIVTLTALRAMADEEARR